MIRYKIGSDDVEAIYIGSDEVDAVYMGSVLIWPISEEDAYGRAYLLSQSSIESTATLDFNASVEINSSVALTIEGSLNNDIEGRCSIISESTLESGFAYFDMYVTSTSIPTILATGGSVIVEEVSTDYWRVYSYEQVSYIRFDYDDVNMRTEVTEVEIIEGKTLTSLNQSFYGMRGMTDFTWVGECNVTTMTSTFANCEVLVNLSVFDTSSVTDFTSCWWGNYLLVDFPVFDTSSAVTLESAWIYCDSIQHFPSIDTSLCENFHSTWYGMDELLSIGTHDTSNGLNFSTAYADNTKLVCIGAINTTNATNTTNMFSNDIALTSPSFAEWGAIITGDDWTNSNPCPLTAPIPPIYNMTEELVTDGVYWYLVNSSSSGSIYNGRLEHSTQSVDGNNGDPWQPTSGQYTQDGTIDLNVNGNATRQINTQWIAPSDSEWSISGIYDVVLGTSYKMYTIHYHGDNTCDIYLGSNIGGVETSPTLVAEGIGYTPPITEWIITDTPPDIVDITIDGIIYEMNSFITE